MLSLSVVFLHGRRYHEQGSTGIENAAPESVMYSLKHARPSFPSTRKDFTVKELQDLGLANTFNGQLVRTVTLCTQLAAHHMSPAHVL